MLLYRPGLIIVERFELRQELGAGGMGIVFGAMDRVLDEDVALKFLPPAMARDQDAIDQFTKEVKRARKVPGEYVLRVHDIWNDGEGGWFVSMEWAKGGDLTAYRRRYGTLSWDQAKTLLLPILQGLQAVHKAGIVHRDIKPANILFREDGTPVVADFGISKSIQASMSRISQDATISGTPAYMAPEAIRGGSEIGFHTDLYAIGCMAYELVTGHTPFVGDPMSVMYNQTHEEPTFTGMPPEAIRWISACLIKDPAKRVHTTEELIRGLEDSRALPVHVPLSQAAFGAPAQAPPAQSPPPRQPPPSTARPKATRPAEPPRATAPPLGDRTYKVGSAPSRAAAREPQPRPAPTAPRRGMDRSVIALKNILVVLVAILGVLLLREKGKEQAPAAVSTTTIQPPVSPPTRPVSPAPTPSATDTKRQQSVEMVRISSGTFTMGSPSSEADRGSDEGPKHSVTVSSFQMGKYEVTQGQYQAVMGTNPSSFKWPKRPVSNVSWYNAVVFCNKLSDREGLTPCYSGSGSSITCNWGATGYRLPTEAEWEYACRAGTTTEYYAGSGESALRRAGWYSGNSGSQTHDVGGKEANAWGLYDMHGNVYEWCWDWYGSYSSSSQTDPKGASSGSYRVYRGGSWSYYAGSCRSAYRGWYVPGPHWSSLGFRLVRR